MAYIKAKKDVKDDSGNIIKHGIDLYSHESDVYDSSISINNVASYGLDNNILKWFGIIHDLGKANPLFQSNMEGITSAKDICCRHEISSVLFIDVVPENIRDIVALLVLSHHKSLAYDERGIREIAKINEWGEAWFSKRNKNLWNHVNGIEEWGKLVADFLFEHYGIKTEIPSMERCKEILYKYATIECNKGYSEYRGVCMMGDHFASAFENTTERILNFSHLFKKPNISVYESKNEKYPLSLIDSDTTKKHTFCVAPTGCGKTNFMMKRCSNRIFYMLPYQASINAMANRIQKDLGEEYIVGIKHASYRSLEIDDLTKDLSNLFGLPVKVMTPFQAMTILFRLKGYESIIMDMKGQDVILDEIHTYYSEEKNMSCIIKLIEQLKEIGCRIHICTATVPTVLMNKIIEILGEDETQIVKLSESEMSTFNRHIIHTIDFYNYEEIVKRYKNGEKILIVRNQIKKAIETYQILKSICEGTKLLLHSRFERGERAELENILINELNKSSEPCIVVSTQVVEVSIDINFDVLFTDCADIMSLIQRSGRVNRQRMHIGLYKDVYVVDVNYENKEHLPYKKELCKKTFEELKKIDGKVLDENYIQTIIDNVHFDIKNFKFELANPKDKEGIWKTEEFSHQVNESIAKNLEFSGCIVIRESNRDEYVRTRNTRYEIPVSKSVAELQKTFGNPIDPSIVGGKIVFVAQDSMYIKGLGLII